MNISAGTSAMRMKKASKSTPAPRAKPKTLMNGSGWAIKEANTAIMISAAAVTTRAPMPKPRTTESSTALNFPADPSATARCECFVHLSLIRERMNTS